MVVKKKAHEKLDNKNIHYIGGKLTKIRLPTHFDFIDDEEYKFVFLCEKIWKTIISFKPFIISEFKRQRDYRK